MYLSAGERLFFLADLFLFFFQKMITSTDKTIDTIFELLRTFNFERIEKMMHAADWKWARFDGLRTPTIDEMRDHCINILLNAKRNNDVISSGGFQASFKINEDGKEVFTLRFIAEEKYIRL